MRLRGRTINVAIDPVGYKNLDPEETVFPAHLEVQNGGLTDAGHWGKRPGLAAKWDTTVDRGVNLLIPEDYGYIGLDNGALYKVNADGTLSAMAGAALGGSSRPYYKKYDGVLYLVNGGQPIKISAGAASVWAGSPPAAKWIAIVSSYVILAGHDPTEWQYSNAGNPEAGWGTNVFNVKKIHAIRNVTVRKELLYFWGDKGVEIWWLAGARPFVRQGNAWIHKGLGASDSVVDANDTFYFFGDDGDFYALDGYNPVVISGSYTKRIRNLVDPAGLYGQHYPMERCVRWLSETDGVTFRYDYKHDMFSEDYEFYNGSKQFLAHGAYMELKTSQGKIFGYVGDSRATGLVRTWSFDNKDDAGNPIQVLRDFALVPSARDRNVRIHRVGWRFKPNVANASEAAPEFRFRFKWDGKPWSEWRQMAFGTVGDNDPYLRSGRIGRGRKIRFQVSHADSTDFLLTHQDLTIEELNQ